jgi:hypothetical protein
MGSTKICMFVSHGQDQDGWFSSCTQVFSRNFILPQVFSAHMHVLAPLNFMLSPITPKKKKITGLYEKHPMDINAHQISAPKW